MKTIGTIIGRLNAPFVPSELEELDLELKKEFLPRAIVREFIQIKESRNPGAQVVTYKKLQLSGGPGKGFVNLAGNSGVRLVNTKATPKANPVKEICYGVLISSAERDAANFAGQDLEEVGMDTVAHYITRDENDLFFSGNADLAVDGVLTAGTAVAGTAGGWGAAADGVTIYNDIVKAYGVLAAVDGLDLGEIALVLNPAHQANLLKMLSSTNPNKNVLETITASGLFPAGIHYSQTIPVDKGIVMSAAGSHCRLGVVKDLTRNREFWQPNGDMIVTWTLRTAGALLYYPESAAILSGIA